MISVKFQDTKSTCSYLNPVALPSAILLVVFLSSEIISSFSEPLGLFICISESTHHCTDYVLAPYACLIFSPILWNP